MVGTGDALSLAAEARGRGRCSDDAKRVFRGEDLSLLLLYTLLSLSATAKFFVVHSKLKRTLANAPLIRTLSPSLSSSFRICGGVSLAPCSSPRTCVF